MGFGLVAGWRTRQGRATPGEGKRLSGQAQQVAMGSGGAGESFTGQLSAAADYGARPPPGAWGSAGAWAQVGVDLAGDVPLESPKSSLHAVKRCRAWWMAGS